MEANHNQATEASELVEVRPHEGGWLVVSGETPIGFIAPDKTVLSPSGSEYTVREGRGAARLWSSEGAPVVNYDREPSLHIKDVASGTVWELRPDWQEMLYGDESRAVIRLSDIFAVPYTLEEAQGTMPAKVKLLLAYLVVKEWTKG